MALPRDVLFDVADRRALRRLTIDEFERVLITGLLFEPHLVMPDVFFFNSPLVLRHVEKARGDKSLLEVAVSEGAIIPAVRQANLDSFSSMVAHLAEENIFGLLPEDDLAFLATRLDAQPASRVKWLPWPERMADSYARLLRGVLHLDDPPVVGEIGVDRDLWLRNEDLRHFAVEDAISREISYGVRRAEVIRSAAVRLKLVAPGDSLLPSEDDLIGRLDDPHKKRDLRAFFKWLDALYVANQADRFGTRLSAVTADRNVLAVMAALGAGSASTAAPGLPPRLDELTVRIPSLATLADSSPGVVMQMRQLGLRWRVAVEAYFRDSTPVRFRAVESAAEQLGKDSRRLIARGALRDFGLGGAVGAGATGVLGAAGDVLVEPGLGLLFSAGAFGVATVRYATKARTERITDPLRTLPPRSGRA